MLKSKLCIKRSKDSNHTNSRLSSGKGVDIEDGLAMLVIILIASSVICAVLIGGIR